MSKLPDTMPKDKGPARNWDNETVEVGDVFLIPVVVTHIDENKHGMLEDVTCAIPNKILGSGDDDGSLGKYCWRVGLTSGYLFEKITPEQLRAIIGDEAADNLAVKTGLKIASTEGADG